MEILNYIIIGILIGLILLATGNIIKTNNPITLQQEKDFSNKYYHYGGDSFSMDILKPLADCYNSCLKDDANYYDCINVCKGKDYSYMFN